MKIVENTVVKMHYTLTNDEGQVIDSSEGREPLEYIQGVHMIVIGLENAMLGHEEGDKFDVKVIPSEGYGEYNPEMTQEVPLDVFQGVDKVVAGMSFYAQTPMGPMPIRIKEVKGSTAIIDANHELAGQNLNFAIEVVSVREASEDDLKPYQQHHCCCKDSGEEHQCKCKGEGHEDGECCGGNKENCDGKGGCGCPHHDEHHS